MTFAIFVSNGSRYEFYKTVEANSVREARQAFLEKCAPSQREFKVQRIKIEEA